MLYVITGGSGSGKSEFAESIAVDIYKNKFQKGKLYYIATMIPYDDECIKRIVRHRNMRSEKGFDTIECFCGIEKLEFSESDVVLIECMSNLIANEMYSDKGRIKGRGDICNMAESGVVKGILKAEKDAGAVVVVTNEVFSDICCDDESRRYLKALGYANRRLCDKADGAAEVVCGIPVWLKGNKGE